MSNPSRIVAIHADESCLGNQFRDRARPGGAGGFLEYWTLDGECVRKDYSCFDADTTNNRMAIRSAILGLGHLRRDGERVIFFSDSAYLVDGITKWVFGWASRGWRRKGGPIQNLGLWRHLCRVAARQHVEWRRVPGHSGLPKNEYADHLAVAAATDRKGDGELRPSCFSEWLKARQALGEYVDFIDAPPRSFKPGRRPPAA